MFLSAFVYLLISRIRLKLDRLPKLAKRMRHGSRKNTLNFGADADQGADPLPSIHFFIFFNIVR